MLLPLSNSIDDEDQVELLTLNTESITVENVHRPSAPSQEGSTLLSHISGLILPYWKLIRSNRDYRVLFISNVLRSLADWFITLASISALDSGTAMALAMFTSLTLIPVFVLGPFIGVVVDRYDRKSVMMLSLCAYVAAVVGMYLCQSPGTLPGFYIFTFLKNTAACVYDPARKAIMPTIVQKELLVVANGDDGLVWAFMLFIGGAAGGLATGLFGITVAFIIGGVTNLFSIYALAFLFKPGIGALGPFKVFFLWIQSVFKSEEQSKQFVPLTNNVDQEPKTEPNDGNVNTKLKTDTDISTSPLQMIYKGFRFMLTFPYVFFLCFFRGLFQLSTGMIDIMNVRSSQTIFAIGEHGAISVGINYMVAGFGNVIQTMVLRRYVPESPRNSQWLLLSSLLQLALGSFALYFSRVYYAFVLSNFLKSGCVSVCIIYSSLLLLQVVPEQFRGRVFAFEQTINTIFPILSRFFGGFVMDNWGWAFEIYLTASSIAFVLFFLWLAYFLLAISHFRAVHSN